MSTADSQLLVGASSCVRDFYQKMLLKGRELTQRHLVLVSRIVIIVLSVLALGVLGIATFIISTLAVVIISLLTDAPAGIQAEMELMKPRYKRKMEPKIPTLRNSR